MAHRNKSSMDYVSLVCCALALVLYLNTLDAGFVYDDRRAILGNPDVLGTTPWYQMLRNDFWGTPLIDSGSHGSYRPLCVLSFKINHMISGYRPAGYHLVNVLLHCLATGLVVKLARHILPNGWGPTVSGLLFAAHPIHTEAVAGIVGRADLTACNFYLLTFLAYIRHVNWREKDDARQWLALGGSIILSAAAVLCKETAVTSLLVCAIFDILRGLNGSKDKLRYRSLMILSGALAIIVHLRLSLPGPVTHFSSADNPTAKISSIWTRFFTFTYLPVFNFKLLVLPTTLSFDWSMDAVPRITTLFDIRNLVTCTFYTALVHTVIRNMNFIRKNIITSNLMMVNRRVGRLAKKKTLSLSQSSSSGLSSSGSTSASSSSLSSSCSSSASSSPTSSNLNLHDNNQLSEHHHHHNNHHHINHQKDGNNNECLCIVCKQSSNIRHSSSCRALNNNNIPAPSVGCECYKAFVAATTAGQNKSRRAKTAPTVLSFVKFHLELFQMGLHSLSDSFYLNNNNANSNSNYNNNNNYATAILLSFTLLILPFLPAANLLFYVGFVVAERILYLPSVGYCLLIGLGFSKIIQSNNNSNGNSNNNNTNSNNNNRKGDNQKYKKRKHKLIIMCLCVILFVFSAKTITRNMDWKDEESLYRSAIGINPPKALGNLGSVLSTQGRFMEAKDALLAALKYRPNMADVHYNLGVLLQNQQDFHGAVDSFQKAIQFRPSLALAYLNLGTSLIALGRCHEAATVLREGSKLDGTGLRDRAAHDNARMASLMQLGGLYADQGKLQRALAVYREALHTIPENYPPQSIYHRLGDIFGRLQQWSEAERFHRAALEAQPDHIAAHISYGTMLAKNSSRTSEAEQWFRRAIRLAPEDPSVRHHYAEFLSSVSRNEESCEQRLHAANLSPNDYSLVVSAATALRLLDRKVEAELWYRMATKLRPDDARAHTNLGAILHLLGRPQQAVASYKEALRLQPNDPTTMTNLAKLGVVEIS